MRTKMQNGVKLVWKPGKWEAYYARTIKGRPNNCIYLATSFREVSELIDTQKVGKAVLISLTPSSWAYGGKPVEIPDSKVKIVYPRALNKKEFAGMNPPPFTRISKYYRPYESVPLYDTDDYTWFLKTYVIKPISDLEAINIFAGLVSEASERYLQGKAPLDRP